MAPPGRLRPFLNSDICGVDVCQLTTNEFTQFVCETATSDKTADSAHPLFVTYLNAACSNIEAVDSEYRAILAKTDIVYADGQAVVWASGYLRQPLPERVNAGDFILEFCRQATARNLAIALVGGRPGVARRAADAWRTHVPDLKIAGTWDGFFDGKEQEVLEQIRRSGANILLVGMGVPLQEKWAWKNRESLDVDVIWCVGALFEYYGESRARAPVWMRRAGLEWLFRLALEPRRLWRRYLVGNVQFVSRVWRYRRRSA